MDTDYINARDQIRSGDLLAWSHRGWGSWYDFEVQMVRMSTRSEYSHVGLAWNAGGRIMVLEAVQPRVRIFPLSMLLPCYWVSRTWGWDDEDLERAMLRVGQEYSKIDAFKAYFNKLKSGANSRWQCAEFIVTSLVRRGFADVRPIPTHVVQHALETGAPMRYLKA